MINLKRIAPFLIILSVTLIILTNWFKYGALYGGGEIGLPTVNVKDSFSMAKYIWWSRISPGFFANYLQSGISLLGLLSILQMMGFSAFVMQIIIFGTMLLLMGIGAYILSLEFLGKEKKLFALVAGLFYMVNPYMMVMVWHRFVFTTILFAAVLPFLFYFWKKWIENKNFGSLFLFILMNLLFSYSFGTLAFVITLWLLLFSYTLLFLIVPWGGLNRLRSITVIFILGFLCWVLTNIWWLLPIFSVNDGILEQSNSITDNIYNLTEISKQSILPFSLPMLNPFYIYGQGDFGTIYSSSIFLILPWVIIGVVFCGFIYCLKQKKLIYLSIIFLISLFFSKGSAPPLSHLLTFIFENFRLVGVIRNPFEKIGILLALTESLLFSLGIFVIYNFIRKKYKNNSLLFIILVIIIPFIYCFPVFLGNVFGSYGKPPLVKVPDSYYSADQWIKENSSGNEKILHLPFVGADTVTYNWLLGYHGIDPTPSLFASLPSLSRPVGINFIDNAINSIQPQINNYESSEEDILDILQKFNIGFVVLHNDVTEIEGGIYDSEKLRNRFNKVSFFDKKKDFGEISVYEVAPNFRKESIFLSDIVNVVFHGKENPLPLGLDNIVKNNPIVNLEDVNTDDEKILDLATNIIIVPKIIEDKERTTLIFDIPMSGKYQLSFNNPNANEYYNNLSDVINVILNNTPKTLTLNFEQNQPFSYGDINLNEGSYQMDLLGVTKHNYAGKFDDLLKNGDISQDGQSAINFKSTFGELPASVKVVLDNKNHGDIYNAKFDISVFEPSVLYIKLLQDTDVISDGLRFSSFSHEVLLDPKVGWQHIDLMLPRLRSNTKEAVYEISILSQSIENPANAFLKNLEIKRKLDPVFILQTKPNKDSFKKENQVNDSRYINPTLAKGHLSIEKPKIFFFKEAFNSGWELKLISNNQIVYPKHYIGDNYANAWYINNPGNYEFTLSFSPQNTVNTARLISFASIIILSVVLIFNLHKRKS